MATRYDVLLRLMLVGDTGVGKTCLICQYAENHFNPIHVTTIGVDFKLKMADIRGMTVKMQIWDTAGQERFEAITKQFYRRAMGVVLVFDICSRSSFESLAKWLLYVKEFSQPETQVIMLGNQCDREAQRQVSTALAQKFAEDNNLRYYETSAKDPSSLDKPFQHLCEEILDHKERTISSDVSITADLNNTVVDLNQPGLQRQDSADTQMEKGEGELPARRGWCCGYL
ncbi:hypothetical protein ACOMHN_018403 [Nucella lapillus]